MKERPILFSGPMVQAILSGAKTQTRRVFKGEPDSVIDGVPYHWAYSGTSYTATGRIDNSDLVAISCPYGVLGDRLWVRETYAIVPRTAYAASEGVQQTLRPDDDHDAAIYRAGWERSTSGLRWKPSIHMPRWASRITLEIADVRVERVQDIKTADIIAEGVHPDERYLGGANRYRHAWIALWDSINAERGHGWEANPWVWVIGFKVVQR